MTASLTTAVVLPCLGLQQSLDRLLQALPPQVQAFVVDDGSAPPLSAPGATLLRHPRNRGYGAAQRTGYLAALEAGADRVVLLHGDGQYHPADTLALADALDQADVALGSRFLPGPGVPVAVPAWRRLGIQGLTGAANLRWGTRYTDLHNGARAFRAEVLASAPLDRFSDAYRFDHQLLAWVLRGAWRVVERPVRMTYGPEVLSISPRRAVAYGLGCLADMVPRDLPWRRRLRVGEVP